MAIEIERERERDKVRFTLNRRASSSGRMSFRFVTSLVHSFVSFPIFDSLSLSDSVSHRKYVWHICSECKQSVQNHGLAVVFLPLDYITKGFFMSISTSSVIIEIIWNVLNILVAHFRIKSNRVRRWFWNSIVHLAADTTDEVEKNADNKSKFQLQRKSFEFIRIITELLDCILPPSTQKKRMETMEPVSVMRTDSTFQSGSLQFVIISATKFVHWPVLVYRSQNPKIAHSPIRTNSIRQIKRRNETSVAYKTRHGNGNCARLKPVNNNIHFILISTWKLN